MHHQSRPQGGGNFNEVAAIEGQDSRAGNISSGQPQSFRLMLIIAIFGLSMFSIRLTGFETIVQNEWRVSAYVLDVLQNGHWLCQTDTSGELASKPPLLTWMVTLVALITGRVDQFALHLPTALAAILTAIILLETGRKYFGWQAGLWAAFSYLACANGYSQIATARYDGLLALPVTLAAVAAFKSWESGRGWTWFWFWAAIGTLIKGPLALTLAAGGLLAIWWCKRKGEAHPFRVESWGGIALFLLITAGWFALAYREVGPGLIDKMLKRELVGHAAGLQQRASPLSGLPMPSLAFLVGYAPWCVAALAAFWSVAKHPAPGAMERRFERFLFCWFFVGLILFSVAAHQRNRLIFPIVPAAALLAGREIARWTARWPRFATIRVVAITAVVLLSATFLHSEVLLKDTRRAQSALAMRALASELRAFGPGEFPLTYVHDPLSLQVVLATRRQEVTPEKAASLLAGEAPAFVVVEKVEEVRQRLPGNAKVNEVFRWPKDGKPEMTILSNYPRLEWPEHASFLLEDLRVETDHARLLAAHHGELTFEVESADSEVTISNLSQQPQWVKLRAATNTGRVSLPEGKLLAAGSTWHKSLH